MTTIITDSFLKARERTIVTELTHEAWSIGEMLGEKSNRVQAILDSREPIVVVSADVLYETLIQEAF
jgi:hypothetical protein